VPRRQLGGAGTPRRQTSWLGLGYGVCPSPELCIELLLRQQREEEQMLSAIFYFFIIVGSLYVVIAMILIVVGIEAWRKEVQVSIERTL